ncbi:hypothetical protein FRC17_006116, partial [Serendipita sp. 399]
MQQLSTTIPQSSTPADGVSPITTIPDEILVKILREYLTIYDSLIVPRLTCRSWRDIVASAISLPRRIYLAKKCKCRDRPNLHEYDYCCRSGFHLVQALELIRGAHFELSINLPILPAPDDTWASGRWKKFQAQCVGINLKKDSNYYSHEMIYPLLDCLPSLRNLRFLTLEDFMSSITRKIDGNANSLKAMKIEYWNPLGKSPFQPESIRDVLAGLSSFSMPRADAEDYSISFSISLFASFRNLKQLVWYEPGHNLGDVQTRLEAVDWRFSLDRLETSYSLLDGFPVNPVLHQLKELVLRASKGDPSSKLVGEQMNLTHLTDLTLLGSWSGLTHINAPNLERLSLHSHREYPLPVVGDNGLLDTRLRPRSVSIHDDGSGSVLVPFLQGPFADVEDLQIFSRTKWSE